MKAKLVQVGNSKGIRIPKSLIEEFDFRDDVELDIQADGLLIRASNRPRTGWNEAFQAMSKNGDDSLLDKGSLTGKWDKDEWEW